jgi:hypothetical protein
MYQELTAQPTQQEIGGAPVQENKLSVGTHIMAGWPLFLVIMGGLIGAGLGGAAYGLNIAIHKSNMPYGVKIGLNIIVGLAAVMLWFLVGVVFCAVKQNYTGQP